MPLPNTHLSGLNMIEPHTENFPWYNQFRNYVIFETKPFIFNESLFLFTVFLSEYVPFVF